jgi:hypothetical protein
MRIASSLVHAALFAGFATGDRLAAQAVETGARSPQYVVRWSRSNADDPRAFVEVIGLSAGALQTLARSQWALAQWQQLLSVHVEQGDLQLDLNAPAMLGRYRIDTGALRFEPKFPLEPGINYRAILHPENLPDGSETPGPISASLRLPSRSSKPTTIVSQVYPSGEIVPENLLKFYVHFSAPMSRGHIYEHIHLRGESGKPIELPFLEIDEELWNPAMTRLTLFIDPGRIKRGVRPLEEVGPALETGKQYTLVIDEAWKDAKGNPLRATFRKQYQVGPPDRDPPDPAQWKIRAPHADTADPIVIDFPEPMDRALAERLIRVASGVGEAIDGMTSIGGQERRWSFTPARPWVRGSYSVVVQTTIEDLAGNNIGKPFEVDVVETTQPRLTKQFVKLLFDVR